MTSPSDLPEFVPNTIVCADSLKLCSRIPEDTFALTLTDIPYGVVTRPSGGLRNLDKRNADDVGFEIPDLVDQLVRVTSGSIYVCFALQSRCLRCAKSLLSIA